MKKHAPTSPTEPLGIRDYLDACNHVSGRARAILLLLTTVTVLVFVAQLNTLQNQWMRARVRSLANASLRPPASSHSIANDEQWSWVLRDRIGPRPDPRADQYQGIAGESDYKFDLDLYKSKYIAVFGAYCNHFVDTAYSVKIPFIDASIDINDLGFVGGSALTVLLTLFAFTLFRERECLVNAFAAAKKMNQTEDFYHLLAAGQVFTTPQTGAPRRDFARIGSAWFAHLIPKLVCTSPLIVQLTVCFHDLWTIGLGAVQDDPHVAVVLGSEVVTCMLILPLTIVVIKFLFDNDAMWRTHWNALKPK